MTFHRLSAWLAVAASVLALSGCKTELYSSLTESEANEVLAALSDGHIRASKERLENGEWQIQVEERSVASAVDLLRSQGLPSQRFSSMGEMFQKQGLVSTPAEERMRYIFAVSQELSQTLRSIDGVVQARVHVVVPQSDPLSEKVRPSSAAVFIKHRPDVDLRLLTPLVKDLVGHSIEGISPDQVSLALLASSPRTNGGTDAAPSEPPRVEVFGMSQSAVLTLLVVLIAGAVSLMALPFLLAKRGIDLKTWLARDVFRR
ncbi:type III secretion system inner membrane ring lipoprotein SctJ [Roseateles sp. NT4]|uniref:type III secretion system inner membrane ring lipoprotein SctJ n=1 Tax=Roseateles sp. NT4 TaxID=3453715 RepID=UPI003EE8EACC